MCNKNLFFFRKCPDFLFSITKIQSFSHNCTKGRNVLADLKGHFPVNSSTHLPTVNIANYSGDTRVNQAHFLRYTSFS